jgi:hypothetical protein
MKQAQGKLSRCKYLRLVLVPAIVMNLLLVLRIRLMKKCSTVLCTLLCSGAAADECLMFLFVTMLRLFFT